MKCRKVVKSAIYCAYHTTNLSRHQNKSNHHTNRKHVHLVRISQ